ncbi:MAG: DNA-primase RepB domain-containing protein, partial [Nodosilinea sp.]
MTRQGHHPAVVVETSPMNYQVWIRLSKDPIPNALATQSAKVLAEHYDGDPNSADWRHFGRLAGFTNRKPVHMRSSGSPYVLAHDCDGLIAPNAQDILHQAQTRLQAKDVTKIREFSSAEACSILCR